MSCPICSGLMRPAFSAQVLYKYQVEYEVCDGCGFLRAHEPHWLDEAYSSAIAAADTGLVMRNISLAGKVAAVLYWGTKERGQGRYLDAAGGYGMLTRLMRDFGFDFYWQDKYCNNLIAPGFEYKESLGPCHAVTAMEVLEHLTDPVAFVRDTLHSSGATMLIITTELYEGDPPHPENWWYYAFPTGQHIGFYQRKTLEVLGARLGLGLSSANGLHILSKEPVSEQLLRLLTNRWVSRIGPWWIRRQLGSKTMPDHERMLKGIS
jgi:Methyltransferase domain